MRDMPVNSASNKDDPGTIAIRARFPGVAGKMRVRVTAVLGQNVLGEAERETALGT